MTPEETLRYTKRLADNLRKLKKRAVFAGLPKENVGGKIYGDGRTIIANGATHEYGYGPIPPRSFLRTPFAVKRDEIRKATTQQFEALTLGKTDIDRALGLIGVVAVNISKGAFVSDGYGTWAPIQPATIERKGSSKPLIDTSTLRNSISWVIRDAT